MWNTTEYNSDDIQRFWYFQSSIHEGLCHGLVSGTHRPVKRAIDQTSSLHKCCKWRLSVVQYLHAPMPKVKFNQKISHFLFKVIMKNQIVQNSLRWLYSLIPRQSFQCLCYQKFLLLYLPFKWKIMQLENNNKKIPVHHSSIIPGALIWKGKVRANQDRSKIKHFFAASLIS